MNLALDTFSGSGKPPPLFPTEPETFTCFDELSQLLLHTPQSLDSSPLANLSPSDFSPSEASSPSSTGSSPTTPESIWEELEVVQPSFMNVLLHDESLLPVRNAATKLNSHRVTISGVPERSRVETQMSVCIQLLDEKGAKVTKFPLLRLPRHLLVDEKLKSVYPANCDVESAPVYLTLSAVVVRSDCMEQISRCFRCIKRERNGRQRKWQRTQQNRNGSSQSKTVPTRPRDLPIEVERAQVLQFYSTSEFIDFSSGEAIVAARISCYCSHHKEQQGFRLAFEVSDGSDAGTKTCASGVSSPVLVCDFHKSHNKRKRAPVSSLSRKRSAVAIIEKTIPQQGPVTGGLEVSVLGRNFTDDLICFFGQNPAITTKGWGTTAITCVLPPSENVGPVAVSFERGSTDPRVIFTYVDDRKRALVNLLLKILGDKLGCEESAETLATQIHQAYTSQKVTVNTNDTVNDLSDQFACKVLSQILILRTTRPLNIGMRDDLQRTLLHYAAMLGFNTLTRKLISIHNSLLGQQDKLGYTPLHFACLYGSVVDARELLNNGARATVENVYGQTPLHLSCQQGDPRIVHMLLGFQGVDVTCQDSLGESPLDYARQRNPYLLPQLELPQTDLVQRDASLSSVNVPAIALLFTTLVAKYRTSLISRIMMYIFIGMAVGGMFFVFQGQIALPSSVNRAVDVDDGYHYERTSPKARSQPLQATQLKATTTTNMNDNHLPELDADAGLANEKLSKSSLNNLRHAGNAKDRLRSRKGASKNQQKLEQGQMEEVAARLSAENRKVHFGQLQQNQEIHRHGDKLGAEILLKDFEGIRSNSFFPSATGLWWLAFLFIMFVMFVMMFKDILTVRWFCLTVILFALLLILDLLWM